MKHKIQRKNPKKKGKDVQSTTRRKFLEARSKKARISRKMALRQNISAF
jgi:hypothetical protein